MLERRVNLGISRAGSSGQSAISLYPKYDVLTIPLCSRPVTMPSSSLPVASLSTLFSFPAGRPGWSISNYLKYWILSSIVRCFSGRDWRFLPALRETAVVGHSSCPLIDLSIASAPAVATDRPPRLARTDGDFFSVLRESFEAPIEPAGRELTGGRSIPILRRFPARERSGCAGIAEARRGPMMRDPGTGHRRSAIGRKVVPAGSRRRR